MSKTRPLLTELLKVSLFIFPRYLLLKYFGFPELLLQWFQSTRRLFSILLQKHPFQVYAFTSFDLWLRSYYAKLARNFQEVGRFGYVWEDSLGFPMGSRFGSNLATYLIYGSLSPQGFGLLTLCLFLASIFLVGVLNHEIFLGIVIIVLLVPSPVVIFSLVAYQIKPEMIWWPFGMLAIYFAFIGQWWWVWIIWSFLLLVNTTVSFLIGALLAGIWLWSLLTGTFTLDFNLFWLMPGLSFRLWRIGYAYFDGNLTATIKEQNAIVKQKSQGKWMHSLAYHLSYGIGKVLLPLLIASWSRWEIGWIVAGTILLLYILSSVWFKVADTVTFQILILGAAVMLALFSGAWIGLVGILWTANMLFPYKIAWNIKGRKQRESLLQSYWHPEGRSYSARIAFYKRLSCDYPWLSARSFPKPPALMELFDSIPGRSRILMESDDDAREGGQFTRFRDWTNEFLPQRQVEFINHTFMNRMLEPGLTNNYLSCFNPDQLSGESMQMVCDKLGVSHVLAFTDTMVKVLERIGWKNLITVSHDSFAELADLLFMPESDLTLLVNPNSAGVISPTVNWTRHGNEITWEAESGTDYLLRYRFHPFFVAKLGNDFISIEPYRPFKDLPLTFMRIGTPVAGKLTVTFLPVYSRYLIKGERTLTKGFTGNGFS